ncbi:MAG: hypothetical protein HUK24_07715, partial [Sphaerochaetaceae bacterium]|nr:hypothetical protein [Sphaerochaetaceae bacterium]
MVKKGISLVGIKDIKTVEHIRATYPNCYFELSYNSTEQELKNLLPIIKDRVCSIHLLSPQRDFFPNIAFNGKTYQWSEKEILKDAIFGAQIGATNLVLHPGYLIN